MPKADNERARKHAKHSGEPTPEPETTAAQPAEAEPPAPQPDTAELVQHLTAELNQECDRRLRAIAELQNYRRRSMEERAQQLQYANERILADLIPVIDHFEMATQAADANDQTRIVCKGYEMILQQLRDVAARHGMLEVPIAPGATFDPLLHDACERVPSADLPEGTVVRQVRKGYRLHDRILRPAQVAVAVTPPD